VTEFGAQPSSSYEPAVLEALLSEARRFGFLGPGPVTAQMERSLAFAKMVTAVPQIAVDLGSGGGLPGLVLALTWPSSRWVFVESNQRRAAWLESALETLGAANRVDVLCDRAENIARTTLRGASDLVTARSFAPPAPTAECAAPLLKLGALLLVAEPPASPLSRWSVEGLENLGWSWSGPMLSKLGAVPRRLVVWWQPHHARRVIPDALGCLSSARCSEPGLLSSRSWRGAKSGGLLNPDA
jgi:16S rRNA (guanine527-N7)-methyltransferase